MELWKSSDAKLGCGIGDQGYGLLGLVAGNGARRNWVRGAIFGTPGRQLARLYPKFHRCRFGRERSLAERSFDDGNGTGGVFRADCRGVVSRSGRKNLPVGCHPSSAQCKFVSLLKRRCAPLKKWYHRVPS